MKEPWFPKEYTLKQKNTTNNVINTNAKINAITHSGDNWQIYKLSKGLKMLAVTPDLAHSWDSDRLIDISLWQEEKIGSDSYLYIILSDKYMLCPLDFKHDDVDKVSAIAFAIALRETRQIVPDVNLEQSIYLEEYARLLPYAEKVEKGDDALLLGKWLTGGVAVSTNSMQRVDSLTAFLSMDDLEEIIKVAGLTLDVGQKVRPQKKPLPKQDKTQRDEVFKLPGAEYLEKFLVDNVIDIVLHPEKYEPFGISFPSPIILYGKPGTGKTYAVEKLSEYLGWPLYSIDSSSIGSTFIHQTSMKISDVFNKAFKSAPSILIIDEMEAYLSNRSEHSHDHKIEEVAEFLRLIPQAPQNNVLIVGMTNLYQNIDPAVLRTGRFDHKIEVLMPSKEDVKAMLNSGLKAMPMEDNISLDIIIDVLENRPRSDTAFIIKEVARLAGNKGKVKISQAEFDEALESLKDNTDADDDLDKYIL